MPRVTELKVVEPKSGLTEVWFEDEAWGRIQAETVVHFRLKKGTELDDGLLEEIARWDRSLRARQALARHTALTLRSAEECRRYLARRGFEEDVVGEAIQDGQERGWLDDRRYAEAYVRQQMKLRPSGPAKLRAALAQRGVQPETADEAIERFGPDQAEQRELAEAIATKRLARMPGSTDRATRRRKVGDHLARQGFGAELVHEVLDRLIEDDGSEEQP